MSEDDPHEHVSPEEAAQAADPNVGSGTPETAPWEAPAVGLLRRQPVLAALLATNAPLIAGLVGSLTVDDAPTWLPVVLAVAVAVLNAAGVAARQAVTPVAQPKLAADTPLVVADDVAD